MGREQVVAEAVNLLAWAGDSLGGGDEAWNAGFARGVKHLAGMLILDSETDWDALVAVAREKAEAARV